MVLCSYDDDLKILKGNLGFRLYKSDGDKNYLYTSSGTRVLFSYSHFLFIPKCFPKAFCLSKYSFFVIFLFLKGLSNMSDHVHSNALPVYW